MSLALQDSCYLTSDSDLDFLGEREQMPNKPSKYWPHLIRNVCFILCSVLQLSILTLLLQAVLLIVHGCTGVLGSLYHSYEYQQCTDQAVIFLWYCPLLAFMLIFLPVYSRVFLKSVLKLEGVSEDNEIFLIN